MKIFVCLILSAAAFIYTGCSGSEGTASVKSTRWELTALMELSSLNFKAKPTINFKSDGRFTGFGGCNNFGGNYKIDGNKLTTSDIYSTEKYCESMQVENIFIQAIQKTSTYEITDSKLYLYSNGSVTAILTKSK
jgi:heat shock protein HslJ